MRPDRKTGIYSGKQVCYEDFLQRSIIRMCRRSSAHSRAGGAEDSVENSESSH